MDRTEMTVLEKGIADKLARASFPPATASKRFVRDISAGYVNALSPRGRRFLAFVAHRFRRQYSLSQEEWAWVREWMSWQDEPAPRLPKPLDSMLEILPRKRIGA